MKCVYLVGRFSSEGLRYIQMCVCLYVMVRHVDGLRGLLLRKLGCRFLLTYCTVICYVCVCVCMSNRLCGFLLEARRMGKADAVVITRQWLKTWKKWRHLEIKWWEEVAGNRLEETMCCWSMRGLFMESWSVSCLKDCRGHRAALYHPRLFLPPSLSVSRLETIAAFFPHIAATKSQKEVIYMKEPDASLHNNSVHCVFTKLYKEHDHTVCSGFIFLCVFNINKGFKTRPCCKVNAQWKLKNQRQPICLEPSI